MLNFKMMNDLINTEFKIYNLKFKIIKELWAEQGSNLRTRERTDLQSVAFNRSAICPDDWRLQIKSAI